MQFITLEEWGNYYPSGKNSVTKTFEGGTIAHVVAEKPQPHSR